jgi:hypothetical protein
MDVGQGREQDAEALRQELHTASMRPLARLEYEAIFGAIHLF